MDDLAFATALSSRSRKHQEAHSTRLVSKPSKQEEATRAHVDAFIADRAAKEARDHAGA